MVELALAPPPSPPLLNSPSEQPEGSARSWGATIRRVLSGRGARGAAPVSVVAVVASLLVASVALGNTGAPAAATTHSAVTAEPSPHSWSALAHLQDQATLELPAATAPPPPAPPALTAAGPLQPHEIFAFAPWWTLAQQGAFDVKDMTTIAYFSVDVNGDGSIVQSGSGWVGYQSQALAALVTRAHAANDRVVLTATCFGQHTLDQLTSDPTAPARLGAALSQLISAKNLDGVNFDFEGRGPRDQHGLDALVGQVASQLRTTNPHWQISMSTYASSAGDPGGFYDIAGLNKVVDAFFVMAYDMDTPSAPSPTAPLTGSGNTDTVDVAEYSSVVPRSKIILGVPYYGYDWPTAGPQPGAPVTGPATPVSYSQVMSFHGPAYWDKTSQTPWSAYQVGPQWHQVYFDDPTSLALKARLANADHIAGLGIWALGMDGNDPSLLGALLGHAAANKYLVAPTPSTSTTSPSSTTTSSTTTSTPYSYSGMWNNNRETLNPVNPSTLPGGGAGTAAGQLTQFSSNDPRFSCLANGPPLTVTELSASPNTYVVQATAPADCASGTWEFTFPASGSSGSTTTTTTSPSTTTTSPLTPITTMSGPGILGFTTTTTTP